MTCRIDLIAVKVAELFPRKKLASTKDRGGLTQASAELLQKQFMEFITPVRDRADVYFREFIINSKERWWLMANESVEDLSVERMAYVLKYRDFFLTEISKAEPDDVRYEFPTNPTNAPVQHSG